jgi:hypothetical protein
VGFVYPGVVEVLNFDGFGPLISCRGRMHVSHAYTLRKTGRVLICGSYRSEHRGQTFKSLVTNDECVSIMILTEMNCFIRLWVWVHRRWQH